MQLYLCNVHCAVCQKCASVNYIDSNTLLYCRQVEIEFDSGLKQVATLPAKGSKHWNIIRFIILLDIDMPLSLSLSS